MTPQGKSFGSWRPPVLVMLASAVALSLQGCGGVEPSPDPSTPEPHSVDSTTPEPKTTSAKPKTSTTTSGSSGKSTTSAKPKTSTTSTKSTSTKSTSTTTTTTTSTTRFDPSKSYQPVLGMEKGQFCGGNYGEDKLILKDGGDSVDKCAAATEANDLCGRNFYFAKGTSNICRCSMVGKPCIVIGPAKDQYSDNIAVYELRAGVSFNKASGYKDGQFCAGDYGWNRKALKSMGASMSPERCATAVTDDWSCSSTFYFGRNQSGGAAGLCRCVMLGRQCVVTDDTKDVWYNTIYQLDTSKLRPRTAFQAVKNYTKGEFCGGAYGTVRKAMDAPGATVSAANCAEAVARDKQCGYEFYFGTNSDASKPNLCRCVMVGNICTAAAAASDGYKNQIYHLTGEAGMFVFDGYNRVWWPDRGQIEIWRNGRIIKGHDDMGIIDLYGDWEVRVSKLLMKWDKYSVEDVDTSDNGVTFSNSNLFQLTSRSVPPFWFSTLFRDPDHKDTVAFRKASDFADGQFCGGDLTKDRKRVTAGGAQLKVSNCAQAVFADMDCDRQFYFSANQEHSTQNLCTCVRAEKKCQASSTSGDGYQNTIYEVYAKEDADSFSFKVKHNWGGTWFGYLQMFKDGRVKKFVNNMFDRDAFWKAVNTPVKDGDDYFNHNLFVEWGPGDSDKTHTDDGGRTFTNSLRFWVYGVEPPSWFVSQFGGSQNLLI